MNQLLLITALRHLPAAPQWRDSQYHHNMNNRNAGFTLIELLVAMALFAVIFSAISTFFISSNRTAILSRDRANLIREGQIAQQFLTGRLSEAVYVWPNGTMTLASTGTTTGNSVGNPSAPSPNWTINTDPFVAMILPPRAPGAACTAASSDGCHRFYAYYAVARSALANDTSLADASRPRADARNPNAWTIMQYQRNLVGWTPTYDGAGRINNPPDSTLYQRGNSSMLVEYIQPDTDRTLFAATPALDPAPAVMPQLFYVQTDATGRVSVDFRYRLERNSFGPQGDMLITVPGNIEYIAARITPRNRN